MFYESAKILEEETVEIRRRLHENPELSNEEYESLAYIKNILYKNNIEYKQVNKGGILAFIEGNNDKKAKKTILLRADIDALPIEESDYNLKGKKIVRSKRKNIMHACGHDAHTAIALSIGKILNQKKDEFSGRLIIAFERGEEKTNNYRYLLAYLDNNNIRVDTAFAIHVDPNIDSGKIAISEGFINSAPMMFDIEILGRSGHGARPYMANSPLDTFIDIINNLNNLRVRNLDPFSPLTYSIGEVKMGETYNQIPDSLRFKGSARFFDREGIGLKFYSDFKKIIEKSSELYNTKIIYHTYMKPHFPIKNDEKLAKVCKNSFRNELGEENLVSLSPSMGSDSFSVYLAQWPGLYLCLGVKNGCVGSGASLHSPNFDIDESAMTNAVAGSLRFILDYLNSKLKLEKPKFNNKFKNLLEEEGLNKQVIDKIYKRIRQ